MGKQTNTKPGGVVPRRAMHHDLVKPAPATQAKIDITGLDDETVVKILKRLIGMRGLKYPVCIVDHTNTSVQEITLDANYELSDFIGVWTHDPHRDEDNRDEGAQAPRSA